jgi:hypothetical protein
MDVCLANWALNLPTSKRSCVSEDGQIDEMLFEAHMINAA